MKSDRGFSVERHVNLANRFVRIEVAIDSAERHRFLRADRVVPYGELMGVMELLRAGGYTKVKLVTLEGVPGAAPAAPAAAEPAKP